VRVRARLGFQAPQIRRFVIERCWSRDKQLLGRLLDVELSIRGILRGFGLKVGQVNARDV